MTERELAWARTSWEQTDRPRSTPGAFWTRMQTFFDDAMWQDNPPGAAPGAHLPRRCRGHADSAPEVMRPLLGKWEYDVEHSLNALRRS